MNPLNRNVPSCSTDWTLIPSDNTQAAEMVDAHPVVVNDAPLFDLPNETIEYIAGHLDVNSLIAFSSTSRLIREITFKRVNEACVRKFNESYGAIASSENEISVSELYRQISGNLSLEKGLRMEEWMPERGFSGFSYIPPMQVLQDPPILQFNEEGQPTLTAYSQISAQDPKFLQFGGNGEFYRGEYHRQLRERIVDLFKKYDAIYDELMTSELDPQHPMNDLRHRLVRVITMEKEIKCLRISWESSLNFHTRYKGQLGVIAKARHEGKAKVLRAAGYECDLPSLYLPEGTKVSSDHFSKNKVVIFSERTIDFGGREHTVQVMGKLYPSVSLGNPYYARISADTSFMVIDKDTKEDYGSIRFTKSWNKEDASPYMGYGEHNFGINVPPITRRSIESPGINSEYRGRNENNGDMPIHRLLTQIFVEVAKRESFPVAEISSSHNEGFVLIAGGVSEGFEGVRSEIEASRKQGKVFPPYRDLGALQLRVQREKGFGKVDFEMGKEPITWEEYFDRHGRLLGDSTGGPVLPRYNIRDLSKYEVEVPVETSPAGPSTSGT